MRPLPVPLPDGRVWLRLADPDWSDPLNPSYAQEHGGRWNPPGSFAVLYLDADVVTVRNQIERMLAGSPVRVDDLDDESYVLVAATLPRSQTCGDATTTAGLRALTLSGTYPLDSAGDPVGWDVCQAVGAQVQQAALRGVWCRAACMPDGSGRELAWFPATRHSRAHPVWYAPLPFGRWRAATTWAEIDLPDQPGPAL